MAHFRNREMDAILLPRLSQKISPKERKQKRKKNKKRRTPYEFCSTVKKVVYRLQKGKCFITGEFLKPREGSFHHWLGIAVWLDHFSWVPSELIKSQTNCIFLRPDVHQLFHDQLTMLDNQLIAQQLMLEWENNY